MTREFPSTAEEAFTSANEGLYWGMQMAKARAERRICPVAYDENAMTYAAWDIGIGDDTALWIFQTVGNSIHFINYYENSGEILPHYVKWVKKLPYEIDKHFLPFDAASRDKSTGKTYADTARELGLKIEVLPKDKNEMYGIDAVRNAFSRIWIDNIKCAKGLKAIDAFRKEWNEKLGCYRDRSLHDWSSHASKALIYAIRALEKHQVSTGLSAEDWKKLRNTYL
jgi:hypothetical protein